ncbi:hypothetical protein ACS0TY_004656 [Phlomoides rotata]
MRSIWSSFMVKFQYQKLTYFCYICGIIGHTEKFCNVLYNSSKGDVAHEWGPELKAVDHRDGSRTTSMWLCTLESDREGWNVRPPFGDVTETVT